MGISSKDQLILFVEVGNDAPVIAGESLTGAESGQTFESNQFKVDWLELVSRSVVEAIEATSRLETMTPLKVVVALHVPRVRSFRSSAGRLPDVSHAGWQATDFLQLCRQQKSAVTSTTSTGCLAA